MLGVCYKLVTIGLHPIRNEPNIQVLLSSSSTPIVVVTAAIDIIDNRYKDLHDMINYRQIQDKRVKEWLNSISICMNLSQ